MPKKIAKRPAAAPREEETPRPRCHWIGNDALMRAYHDEEWGVPVRESKALFAKLVLDGFQAGLSWRTILHKRAAFLRAFEKFDPVKLARYGEAEVARLLGDAGIIRHRGKIEAAISNARAFLALEKEEGKGAFGRLLWELAGGATKVNRVRTRADIATESAESRAISQALRARGMKFVGPTIVYAFMQAVGMVDDHLDACFRKGAR